MSGFRLGRQPSYHEYDSKSVDNPFLHEIKFRWYDYVQIAVMSVTLAPIRFALLGILIMFIWVLSRILTFGMKKSDFNKPITGWRIAVRPFIVQLTRLWFITLGYYNIKVRGQLATHDEAPILVYAPHTSFMDAIALILSGLPSPLSRIENAKIPIIGSCLEYLQPVYVIRDDPNSRRNTVKEIRKRAEDKRWSQICIFPEGTCGNGRCLIQFRPGAFYPGVPVQPITISYLNRKNTTTWTWQGAGILKLVWLTLCQFYMNCEVRFLPVYKPNEAEKADPILYAKNVRKVMAEALMLPMSEHTYDDNRFVRKISNTTCLSHVPDFSVLREFATEVGVTYDAIDELRQKVADNPQLYLYPTVISFSELCKRLDILQSPSVDDLLSYFQTNSSNELVLQNFLIAMMLSFGLGKPNYILNYAFKIFSRNSSQKITMEQFKELIHKGFLLDAVDTDHIFKRLDCRDSGYINHDQFRLYLVTREEYRLLFDQIGCSSGEDDDEYDD